MNVVAGGVNNRRTQKQRTRDGSGRSTISSPQNRGKTKVSHPSGQLQYRPYPLRDVHNDSDAIRERPHPADRRRGQNAPAGCLTWEPHPGHSSSLTREPPEKPALVSLGDPLRTICAPTPGAGPGRPAEGRPIRRDCGSGRSRHSERTGLGVKCGSPSSGASSFGERRSGASVFGASCPATRPFG
jgi:hypothetical protein